MTETEELNRIAVRITGRVQGVGFRNFTRRTARELGVVGWVRNEPDGSVRLEAEGPSEALEQLVDAVQKGPASARVDDVEVEQRDARNEFDRFSVRYV